MAKTKKPASRSKRSYRPRRKTAPKAKGLFKKKVMSVINSVAEDKVMYTSNNESALVNFNSGITTVSDMCQILPNNNDGVNENNRIGDELRLKTFNVKGYLRVIPVASGPTGNAICQVGVRMMILSLKKAPSWDLVQSSAAPLSSLLRAGGASKGFTGLISDLFAPINTDLFTTHYNKVHYCTQEFVNRDTTAGYWSSDIKNQIKFFNINLKVKDKKLTYDDDTNGGLLPTNYAPFLCIGYSYLNGGTGDVVAANVGLHYQSHITFQDM